ncbi:hypothetical protein COLO4_19977 [Corchorus olitorius]|uniref:Uncharacterized protein n=1 Tax=Corchorus olitorius TaxID=93759 RepID=A0A1R3J2I2_9ROSI|nr:hypothetical protein COLO4_19977 [Corchorus olitorius]
MIKGSSRRDRLLIKTSVTRSPLAGSSKPCHLAATLLCQAGSPIVSAESISSELQLSAVVLVGFNSILAVFIDYCFPAVRA